MSSGLWGARWSPCRQVFRSSNRLRMVSFRFIFGQPFGRCLVSDVEVIFPRGPSDFKAPVLDYAAMDPLVFHIAFGTTDVRGTLQRLLAAGATSAGEVTTTPAGDEMAFLRDPWGVALQLV